MKIRNQLVSAFAGLVLLMLPVQAYAAAGSQYPLRQDLIGAQQVHIVQKEDTLYDLARQYKIGLVELMAANPGIDPWVPTPGVTLVLPSEFILPVPPEQRKGIVINLAEMRLYFFPSDGQSVFSYPLGIGREGWQTPEGTTHISRMRKHPVWIPPASIRAENPDLPAKVPAGPNNPLGDYAMSLGWPSYTIHGTDKPDGIGMRSSHGCLRMYPEDIEELFDLARKGLQVRVVDQPYKLGESGGELYLEVSPTQEQTDELLDKGTLPHAPLGDDAAALTEMIQAWEKRYNRSVDWHLAGATLGERRGIPVRISLAQETAASPETPPVQEEVTQPAPVEPAAPAEPEALPEEDIKLEELQPLTSQEPRRHTSYAPVTPIEEQTPYPLPETIPAVPQAPAVNRVPPEIQPQPMQTPALPAPLRPRSWRPIPDRQ